MKKVCVILGAGASKDAWSKGGPPWQNSWIPPLANELFQFDGAREPFWQVAKDYRGVRVIAPLLAERGDVALEEKLLELSQHRDSRIKDCYKEVPPYLRDLILHVTVGFTQNVSPGSHLHLVGSLLGSDHNVAFLDLNYDDYLEKALADFDPRMEIKTLRDYTNNAQVLVGKIHGSIHWGVPIPWHGTLEESLAKFGGTIPPNAQIIWSGSRQPARAWFAPGGSAILYPLLTAPLAGKDHTALVCTRETLKRLQVFLKDCAHYLVVGTSGQDTDLLEFLTASVSSVRVVHYVNFLQETTRVCQVRVEAGCRVFKAAPSQVLYPHGFRAYLGSEQFQDFLRA
jgi:hypothetical protein